MRIDYKLVDLDREKYTECIESFMELEETHLHWKARYWADIPIEPEDLDQGWENKLKSHEAWVKREQVMAVGCAYLFRSKVWQVFIDASGMASTIEVYFKRESEAQAFAQTMVKWMLKKQ